LRLFTDKRIVNTMLKFLCCYSSIDWLTLIPHLSILITVITVSGFMLTHSTCVMVLYFYNYKIITLWWHVHRKSALLTKMPKREKYFLLSESTFLLFTAFYDRKKKTQKKKLFWCNSIVKSKKVLPESRKHFSLFGIFVRSYEF
jgi:hypothetical protein